MHMALKYIIYACIHLLACLLIRNNQISLRNVVDLDVRRDNQFSPTHSLTRSFRQPSYILYVYIYIYIYIRYVILTWNTHYTI